MCLASAAPKLQAPGPAPCPPPPQAQAHAPYRQQLLRGPLPKVGIFR